MYLVFGFEFENFHSTKRNSMLLMDFLIIHHAHETVSDITDPSLNVALYLQVILVQNSLLRRTRSSFELFDQVPDQVLLQYFSYVSKQKNIVVFVNPCYHLGELRFTSYFDPLYDVHSYQVACRRDVLRKLLDLR